MSAFGGKADMKWTRLNVRLWPQADIGSQQPDSAYPPIVRGNCYSAATATSAIYCEIQAFRRFTLARQSASNSPSGKECVDGCFINASAQPLSRGYLSMTP